MSILRKGKRSSIKERNVKAKNAMIKFNRILFELNKIYHTLKKDTDLTKENIKEKINNLSTIELSEEHIDMLISDLIKNDNS